MPSCLPILPMTLMASILRRRWLERVAGLPSSRARRAAAVAWASATRRRTTGDDDLVAVGADLEPGTLLAAYRRGLFPMPSGRRGDPMAGGRPVRARGPAARRPGRLPLAAPRRAGTSRSGSTPRSWRWSTAAPTRAGAGGWIDADIRAAYLRLHELGWAHSVEAWRDGRLAGGLYGVAIGGLFAGESMFHRDRDASKVALVGLVELLRDEHGDATG